MANPYHLSLFPLSMRVSVCLQQDVIGKRKQSKTLSAAKVNLSDYASGDDSDPINIPLKFKKTKETATFVVMISKRLLLPCSLMNNKY